MTWTEDDQFNLSCAKYAQRRLIERLYHWTDEALLWAGSDCPGEGHFRKQLRTIERCLNSARDKYQSVIARLEAKKAKARRKP